MGELQRVVCESDERGLADSDIAHSTFALCFWYSLKMYTESRFNSAETLIV